MNRRLKISKMITSNYILILLLLIISTYKLTHAVHGFDSASSCSPNNKQSRRGRAQILATIPCDLTQQAYCNIPGPAYPWNSVRRFVHENQGMMKRMYGDIRQISVLRDEINHDDIEMAAERYSRNGGRRSPKFMNERTRDRIAAGRDINNNDFATEIPMTTIKAPARKTSDIEANSTETTEIAIEEPTKESLKEVKANENNEKTKFPSKNTNIYIIDDDGNLASNSIPTLAVDDIISLSTGGDNIEIIASPKLNTTPSTTTTSTTETTTTKPQTTTATSTTTTTKRALTSYHNGSYRRRPQYTNRYRPLNYQHKPHYQQQQNHRVNTTILTMKESPSKTNSKLKLNETEQISNTSTTPTSATGSTPTNISQPPSGIAPLSSVESSPIISVKLKVNKNNQTNENNSPTQKRPWTFNNQFAVTPSSSPSSPASLASSLSVMQQKIELFSAEKFHKPEQKPTTTSTPTSNKPLRDGQLYQDTVKKEQTPTANIKGINACPVKEEVVAPFWANNTRGEILALLNVHPFQQYVHWEKCTNENKQMYCRDGCRCEQQYSLHRLLAYDPYNECRGIFSDWFRFPSCCTCRCYNIPAEFRATSRSPRMQSSPSDEETIDDEYEDPRHPLEIAEEQVRRAIYEHATEDWYRPNDDDYNYNYMEDY